MATFNLRNHTARDGDNSWPLRVDAVAEMIRRLDARFVGTQEGYHEMLQQLSERLPEYRWVGQGRDGGERGEHCAIFYRAHEAVPADSGHFWLSATPERPGSISWNSSCTRMCTWARFQATGGAGGDLLVYNTHLDHVSEEARERGARLICERLDAGGRPAVLMGDLNAQPGSGAVRFLRAESGLSDAYAGREDVGRTFHGFRGGSAGEPIDYIFGTPELRFSEVEVRREQVGGRYPSDHYPVVARVRA